jgi:hypothetical protein
VNALRDSAPPGTEHPDDYPFGFDDLEHADATTISHIRAVVNALDAVADVAVAEGAHQALQGNTERALAGSRRSPPRRRPRCLICWRLGAVVASR